MIICQRESVSWEMIDCIAQQSYKKVVKLLSLLIFNLKKKKKEVAYLLKTNFNFFVLLLGDTIHKVIYNHCNFKFFFLFNVKL